MRIIRLSASVAAVAAAVLTAPSASASASAQSFCGDLGGDWDGQYCHASVTSERKAVRDIKMALPVIWSKTRPAAPRSASTCTP